MNVPPFERGFDWSGPSGDPNDEQFGDVVRTAPPDAVDGGAVLVGEPYDGAVLGRPGAAGAPRAIRETLAGLKTRHFDAGPVRSVADAGDVSPPRRDGGVAAAQEHYRAAAAAAHRSDALPVFLGGDNSLSYANVAPLLDGGTEPSVAVCNFDAHLDVRESPDGPNSGTPYRQLLDAGLDGYAVVGARHFETSTAYVDYLREHPAATELVTAEEVGEDPVAAVDRALSALDADRLYLSVDCDVLDGAAAPGVSAPTPGGLTTRELFRCLRLCAAEDRLAGFEVVECAPPLDREGRTVGAAARAVAHVLAGAGA